MFTSWGKESTKAFTEAELNDILSQLEDEKQYGRILRAKGIVPAADGVWLHFDYIPGEADVRVGPASVIGRLCVIGAELHEDALAALFGV